MMRRRCCLMALAAVATLLVTCPTSARRAWRTRPALRYPMRCAGLTVGRSTDAAVRKLYGKGWFTPDEGHLGGRYFVDPKRTVTLHVEIGVDSIIDTVEYRQGVHLPRIASERGVTMATTARLTGRESLQGGLRLGASPKDVIAHYGRPLKSTTRGRVRTLAYEADEHDIPDIISYEATFTFHDGRLTGVSLYNGE